MTTFIKSIVTKRQLAEMMLRLYDTTGFNSENVVNTICNYPEQKFLKNARKATSLNIATNGGYTYLIKYEMP
jgi:hypothetical protein